ncbi:MAG TPA: FHA domain-containing protein, partial [Polyangiaceae bacterium]|nr:FHA domain-containing protein [Polyangiaceae bacterium]
MSNASRRALRTQPDRRIPAPRLVSQVWHKDQAREPEATAQAVPHSVPARNRPLLFVVQGPLLGSVFAVEGGVVLIGRGSHAGVIITDDTVSREHARLSLGKGKVFLEDLGSQGGTYLNGVRISGRTQLEDGDRIGLGRSS